MKYLNANIACSTWMNNIMAESTSQSFHLWSSLSTELKLEVLVYCLESPFILGETEHRRILRQTPGPIIQTRNAELVQLAQDVYYKENTFQIYLSNTGFRSDFNLPHPAIATEYETYGSLLDLARSLR
jgi:hypothetical protein